MLLADTADSPRCDLTVVSLLLLVVCLVVCCGAALLAELLFDERELFTSRVVLLRAGVSVLFERLFIVSRFAGLALLVDVLLFTSPLRVSPLLRVPSPLRIAPPLRVSELTVPLVAEEPLVVLFTLPDLETFPLLLLELPGV